MPAIKSHKRNRKFPSQFTDLVKEMPPQAIMDDAGYSETVERIDRLMSAGKLTKGQSIYMETLVQLVQAYEASHHAIDTSGLGGLAALKHLLHENGMSASDLARLLGVHASMGSKILKGERSLTIDHVKKLGAHFQVDPSIFVVGESNDEEEVDINSLPTEQPVIESKQSALFPSIESRSGSGERTSNGSRKKSSAHGVKRGRDVKWTQELRRVLYARLVMEFGTYDQWGRADYPHGRKSRYEEVLSELAAYFSMLTGETFKASAVQQQVRWGYTRQESVLDQSHARSFILNKAAALEVGFIPTRLLPSLLTARE